MQALRANRAVAVIGMVELTKGAVSFRSNIQIVPPLGRLTQIATAIEFSCTWAGPCFLPRYNRFPAPAEELRRTLTLSGAALSQPGIFLVVFSSQSADRKTGASRIAE